MKRSFAFSFLFLFATAAEAAPIASYSQLTTGNGHGFTVFDVSQARVTQFLERPYKYVSPGNNPMGEGVQRRNLAYDAYFGARVAATGAWMSETAQQSNGYVEQSGIIASKGTLAGVEIESYFFAPYGYAGNALVMIARAKNTSASAQTVDLFAIPNFHLGAGDPNSPTAQSETIAFNATAATETGPGGGAMIYMPIGGFDRADASGTGYDRVKMGQDLLDTPRDSSGDDRVLIYQRALGSLAPGAEAWWGLAIAFSDDNAQSAATITKLQTYVNARGAQAIFDDERAAWAAWRKPPPAGLSTDELAIYRQSEAILRMAQILEPYSSTPKRKGRGMLLASLPPGIWHIGWVRDAQYAIAALARIGHHDEAKRALNFFLDAEGNRYQSYAGSPYRISVTRYFGDGQEESDWNADGPNIEFDGWGLYLWAARTYVEASGDTAWLHEQTQAGEDNYTVLRDLVAAPLEATVEPGGLVTADSSIWEVHWTPRKHFTYTTLAAARGLCDFAALSSRIGEHETSARYRLLAERIRAAVRAQLVDADFALAGSLEVLNDPRRHDAAVVEAINWGVIAADDMVAAKTVDMLDVLRVATGGLRRNNYTDEPYDANEWIFIDLRASLAMKLLGRTMPSAQLVSDVVAQGRLNYDLLPELFNNFAGQGAIGAYAGAIPMVGFGAGAYALALLGRDAGRALDDNDCGSPPPPDGGMPQLTDGGVIERDAGSMTPVTPEGCACSCARDAGFPFGAALLTLALFTFRYLTSRRRKV